MQNSEKKQKEELQYFLIIFFSFLFFSFPQKNFLKSQIYVFFSFLIMREDKKNGSKKAKKNKMIKIKKNGKKNREPSVDHSQPFSISCRYANPCPYTPSQLFQLRNTLPPYSTTDTQHPLRPSPHIIWKCKLWPIFGNTSCSWTPPKGWLCGDTET